MFTRLHLEKLLDDHHTLADNVLCRWDGQSMGVGHEGRREWVEHEGQKEWAEHERKREWVGHEGRGSGWGMRGEGWGGLVDDSLKKGLGTLSSVLAQ